MSGAVRDLFPAASTSRSGIVFGAMVRSEADVAVDRMVARHVGDIAQAQRDALDTVCWIALEHGLEVHVQRKWGSRFVGLELAVPLVGHPCPVVYEHQDDGRWLEWE